MKRLLTFGTLIAVAGCVATTPQTQAVSRTQAATCWQQAGLEGDLYKFYNPAQHGVLTANGNASQSQIDAFNACLGLSV